MFRPIHNDNCNTNNNFLINSCNPKISTNIKGTRYIFNINLLEKNYIFHVLKNKSHCNRERCHSPEYNEHN